MRGDHDRVGAVQVADGVDELHAVRLARDLADRGRRAYVADRGGHLVDVRPGAPGHRAPLRRTRDRQEAMVLQELEQVARRIAQRRFVAGGPYARHDGDRVVRDEVVGEAVDA